MTWTVWNWINVFCIFFSGYVAAYCFARNNNLLGWFNIFASALNLAIVLVRVDF